MKICLATVHSNPAFTPLALLYLKAYLVQQGTLAAPLVRILECTADDSPEAIAFKVLETEPEIVGLSCYVWNITTLLAVSRQLKTLRPGVRIVLGGPEVGPVARSVIEQNASIDCVVKSEGEIAFNAIVDTWKRGDDIAKVAGIFYRREDTVCETADATVLRDLNELPSPLKMIEGDLKNRIVCIETQRGCVFRCNFCFEGKDLSIRNRRFDMERVKDEILSCLRQDIAWLYLMDPVFNLNAARAKDICSFIAQHNHRRIPVHAEVWAEFIDEEMTGLMRAANFGFLEVGLQTTDQKVLVTVERRLRIARFVEGIEHLKRHKIPFQVQLIYGLPGETRQSFRNSLNFAASLQAPDLAVFPLMVLPGTELRTKATSLEIEFDPAPPYLIRSHRSMSPADIAYGMKVSAAVNGVGRLWTLRLLGRERGLSFADVIDAWIEWVQGDATDFAFHDGSCDAENIRQFVLHICTANHIPPEFYAASSSLEFSAREQSFAMPA